ncbi:MAG: tetratricopeptide repeat protein [Ignavibacteriaceae bacterium]
MYRYLKFLPFCFLVITIVIHGKTEPDSLFNTANNFYIAQQYDKAAEIYEKLISEGYESASLFYNLGNAYYKLGRIGLAIANYHRALELSPGDEDIQYNLNLANSKTIDRIETLPEFFLFQWWESILALLTLTGWTYLTYLFFLLILFSIGLYFFAKSLSQQRISIWFGTFSLLIFITSAIILGVKLNRELNIRYAVVVVESTVAKLSPDDKSGDAFIIHEGLKVKIEDELNNWYKIRLNDGKVAWLPASKLEII